MGGIDIDKIAEIHRQLDKLLLSDWDPIGVRQVPQCLDEYSRYVREVFDVAVQSRSARAIAQHLLKIERERMSLSRWRRWQTRRPVAEKILQLVEDVDPVP
jgi:hypothetical protein